MELTSGLIIVAISVLLTMNPASCLECYECNSLVETSDNACTLGLNTIRKEKCQEEEACYTSLYAMTKIDGSLKFNMTVRTCGKQIGGCATEHLRQTGLYGQSHTLEQILCTKCDKDLCNIPAPIIQSVPGTSQILKSSSLFICLLFLVNKFF